MSVMDTDRRTAQIDREALQLIFERVSSGRQGSSNSGANGFKLHEKAVRRSEDDRHQAERQQRRLIDALRSKVKHLDPPIGANDSWDQVRPRIQNCEEYRALDSDDLRRTAFEKVIRRLKEKEEDAEQERSRREKEHERSMAEKPAHRHHDRERDRERERERERDNPRSGHPSHHRSARHSRPSRTPEPDAYEAERKKAQAERERQYRKTSVGGRHASPHHHRGERERTDRDRDRGRDRGSSRTASMSHYDRERREREEERERLYRTRGDPRGSRDELDYGESKSSGGSRRRRRGDSDAESISSRRDSKVRQNPGSLCFSPRAAKSNRLNSSV